MRQNWPIIWDSDSCLSFYYSKLDINNSWSFRVKQFSWIFHFSILLKIHNIGIPSQSNALLITLYLNYFFSSKLCWSISQQCSMNYSDSKMYTSSMETGTGMPLFKRLSGAHFPKIDIRSDFSLKFHELGFWEISWRFH